jgi:hypothetical protein
MTISAKDLPMAAEWRGIKSMIRIDRERIMGDKKTHERVYYISSLDPNKLAEIARVARKQWGRTERFTMALRWSV